MNALEDDKHKHVQIPREFEGFELYRKRNSKAWRRDCEPTAEECADSCWANMQTAAAELAKAKAIYARMAPGAAFLQFALGECSRLRAEQRHWQGMREHFRAQARTEARDPRLPREPGEDDV